MAYGNTAVKVDFWRRKIGLLPVYLHHNRQNGDNSYAMLDGDICNFCLDLNNVDDDQSLYRSMAWSANMQNYIKYDEKSDKIKLYSLNNSNAEEIPLGLVSEHIDDFYKYLGDKTFNDDSVVRFIIRQFRIIRTSLREKDSAEISLKIFLYILSRLDVQTDNNDWGLPEDILDCLQLLQGKNYELESIISMLKQGLVDYGFKPNIDMILRHASGQLFEEANFIAHFNNQLSLFPTEELWYLPSTSTVGAYYTPSYLARTLVEESLRYIDLTKKKTIKIFDPACGPGQLLVEALRQLKSKGFEGEVYITGWDKTAVAKIMADFQLTFESREWNNKMHFVIIERDSLDNEWPKDMDIIIMNPPYKSWALMDKKQRGQITALMGQYHGKINLAEAFYYLAVQAIKKDGVVGCILPSSFLTASYISKMRNDMFDKLSPKLIAKLGNFVFRSAYVDVSFIVASNNNLNDTTEMLWTDNRDNVTSTALRTLRMFNEPNAINIAPNEKISIYNANRLVMKVSDAWTPIPYGQRNLYRTAELKVQTGSLKRVKDIFDVRIGARTGGNSIFSITVDDYNSLSNNERKYFRPSVDSQSIVEGRLFKKAYLFYPYPLDKFPIDNEEELKQKLPVYYTKFLLPNKAKLMERAEARNGKWWLLSRPGLWQFDKKVKLVSAEFGHAGNFSIDESGDFVVHRGCAWNLKGDNKNVEILYFYLAIYNSSLFNSLLKIYSRQLSGGVWYVIEKKYMDKIPIPSLEAIGVGSDIYNLMRGIGRAMVKGETYNKEILNTMVAKIYGQE